MKLYLLIPLIVLTIGLQAQQKRKVQFGLNAGVNQSWSSDGHNFGYSKTRIGIGVSVGAMLKVSLNKKFGFSSGVNYLVLNDGGEKTEECDNSTLYHSIKSRYWHIPLVLNITAKKFNGKYRIITLVGPSFAFLSKTIEKTKAYKWGEEEPYLERTNYRSVYKPKRYSVIVGVMMEVQLKGNTSFIFGPILDYCFIDIDLIQDKRTVNNYIALNAGILF